MAGRGEVIVSDVIDNHGATGAVGRPSPEFLRP
jgi:hypothetical protein